MSPTRVTLTIAVAALLAVPAATATWYSYGTYEPDTDLDVAAANLNTHSVTPAQTKGDLRVYFNGYTTWGPTGQSTGGAINPNVGALKSNFEAPGNHWFEALIGIWQDCNKDGYVGLAETAAREYSDAIIDDTVCEKATVPMNYAYPYTWNGKFAANGWVTEFIPVAAVLPGKISDARTIEDPVAHVWMDGGLPDDNAAPPSIPCLARARYGHNDGDSRTTGGLVYWFDCQGQGALTVGSTTVHFQDTWDSLVPATYRWGNDPRQSSSPLNVKTFGDDDAEKSAVFLQDCSTDNHDYSTQPGEAIVGTSGNEASGDYDRGWKVRRIGNGAGPSGGTGDVVRGEIVNDGANNQLGADDVSYWSIPGTLNYTAESTYSPFHARLGPQPTAGYPDTAPNSPNCDWSDDSGQDFYYTTGLERPIDIPAYGGKDTTSNFVFYNAQRGGFAPANVLPMARCRPGYPIATAPVCVGGNNAYSTDMGIDVVNVADGSSSHLQSNWFAGATGIRAPATVVRDGLPDDPYPTPSYWTFYGRVGSATKAFSTTDPATDVVYGVKQCGDNAAISNWNCDQKAWYKRTDGTYPEPPQFGRINEACTYTDGGTRASPTGPACRAIVGDTYNLRDIDCWDGDVHQTIGLSTQWYNEDTRCKRPVEPLACVEGVTAETCPT